jgi:ribosomal protein S18 acetylase RimI-like enzyme
MEHIREQREIGIRQASTDDIPFICSLAERFARVGTPAWRDPTQMWQFHQRGVEEASVAINTPDSLVLLAEDRNGTRLGFIYVTHTLDFFTHEPQGYIADLAVSEQAEGKGVGRKLMESAEAWASTQGYRILALDVFAFNTSARSFYKHLGYVEETVKLIKEL